MPDEDVLASVERFDRVLSARPGLRLRICCPSQEFTRAEMAQGTGRWLSCARGLWESLTVAEDLGVAVVMIQAPPVPDTVVRHLLALRPGTPAELADRPARHLLLGIDDDTDVHLSEKLLARPHLLRALRALVDAARQRGQRVDSLSCYQSSDRMDAIADALGLDQVETPSTTLRWGTKAGSRQIFRAAGVPHAPGTYSPSRDLDDIAARSAELCERHGPGRWLLKVDEGFGTGHGNALYTVDTPDPAAVLDELRHRLVPMATTIPRADFLGHVAARGAVIERFMDARRVHAPSTLSFADGRGAHLLGTHDQVMGDESNFTGAHFPADPAYRAATVAASHAIVDHLVAVGVRGHIGVDFLALETAPGTWDVRALELNLRQTGTTHPNRTVRALIPGDWQPDGALLHGGHPVHYESTDNLIDPAWRSVTPEALIARLTATPDLAFDPRRARGVVPHLWTALAPFGKIGATFVGASAEECAALRVRFQETMTDLAHRFPAAANTSASGG